MSSSDGTVSNLKKETEQNRLDLLRTDLDLIHTLTDLVGTELKLKSRDHAVQTYARAGKGYGHACRIFEQRKSWGEKPTNEIEQKLADLRSELGRLKQLLYPGKPAQ